MKFRLVESSELFKGIFWIVDLENINKNRNYCFTIPSDMYGNVVNNPTYNMNAKSGSTYNHERLWSELPKDMTNGKEFNYYPRGRVEINNGRADIYLNPNINTEDVINFIKGEFNLIERNGISSIKIHSDGSEHYKCYLDN